MGIVYKALDSRDGKIVALKVLSRQSLLDGELKHRFLREASAGSKLLHPNVVRIYEVGEADGDYFISMEFLEGKTLQAMVRTGPLAPPLIVNIGIAVADALREAHRQGIIHRDIKSANIMLAPDGEVKVMDFGLAKIQNASMLTREGELMGTVTYMSPEQASGEPVDPRSDIFSLGVVLYELLTGKLPFGDEYEMAVVYSILNVEPARIRDLRPEVPEALEQIVFKALRKDLQYRYQNVEELLGDLRRMKAFMDGKRDTLPSPLELVAGAGLEEETSRGPHVVTTRRSGFQAKLVGRDEELEELKAHLRKADGGEGRTVFIAGEAGVGKSRLVSELEIYARTIKVHPLNTRCVFREGATPYRPFVEAVRDIIAARGLVSAEEIESYFRMHHPAVVSRLPALRLFLSPGAGAAAALLSKDQLWEAVLRLLEAVSRERTLLLVIDDLQWADEETLRLLQYLSRTTREMPVLIVGTYRPEDAGGRHDGSMHPLSEIEREMLHEECLTVMRLERLTESDVRQLVSSLFTQADFGKAFLESLYRESEGNPLFIMEILKLLSVEGLIEGVAGTFRLSGEMESVVMPSRIQDIVGRRVARLERHEREILEIGAVEGETFHSDTISCCLEANRLSILRTLQSLEREYHIIHAQEKVYRFDHAKIRDALYDAMLPELRTEYHRMIGTYLASAYRDDEQLAFNIAHHFLEAGADEKALPFLVTAGRRAKALFSNLQAIHFFEKALRICQTLERTASGTPVCAKTDVLEMLGEVCMMTGGNDRALEAFEMLLQMPDLDPVKRGEVLQRSGDVYVSKGDHERALTALAEAERILAGAGPVGTLPEADVVRGKTAITRARLFKARGEYDAAIRWIDEGLKLLGTEGHLHERADALNDLGNIYEDRSEYDRAREMFARSLELREEIADKKGIAVTYNNLANISCAASDYGRAAAMFRKSLDLMKEIGYRAGIAGTCNNLGTIYQDQGRYQESVEMYRRGLRIREEIGDRPGIAMSYGNLGFVHCDLGEYAAAKDYLTKSLRLQNEIGMRTLAAATTSWLALAEAGSGNLDAGMRLAAGALTLADGMRQTWFEGIAHRSMGIIMMKKWEQGRAEDLYAGSLEHLQRSLAIFEEGSFEHEAARSSLEIARLLMLGRDHAGSAPYLEKAVTVFQKLGAMGDLDRAMAMRSVP